MAVKKNDLKPPAIYNDGAMSLRIKCFVSVETWLSGKDCRHTQGMNDSAASDAPLWRAQPVSFEALFVVFCVLLQGFPSSSSPAPQDGVRQANRTSSLPLPSMQKPPLHFPSIPASKMAQWLKHFHIRQRTSVKAG